MVPSAEQASALHRKYHSNDKIVEHCRACAAISLRLCRRAAAQGNMVDERAAVSAALLHDIGRSRTQLVDHGHVGAAILEEEGVDKEVVEIVRKHVGAGISTEEAASLGFPAGDYVPRTLEQKIVCFADKMLDGDRARPFVEEEKRFVKKGHDVERLRQLKRDVDVAVGGDAESLVLFG
ncbi:MAG: HDIG domain-containing protein [Nitrososphaerota archaeon]|nr:HDIG domain-containing protein [Nitrososphaerota archaeon]MDG6966233.1 HDIG domain-containing protein [Nitrososphaerota archaeon]MDG6968447.1 HDIG domain-containing protein [Nitrososphaerota archaeon]MDG6977668.1 HDIG domain-containing protein [Nitrososphaerota archaeon]MDG7022535.1 HDIG domain-containing protein [Nitrososphaerota archaeon]